MSDDFNPQTPPPPAPGPQQQGPQQQGTQYPGVPYGQAAQYAPRPYGLPYAPPFYPQRRPQPAWFWPAIIFGSILLVALILWGSIRSVIRQGDETTAAFATQRIAVINLDGVIVDAEKVDSQLRKFGDDDTVKAIVLHINSPGGGAAASQEIYNEVLRIRQEKHKKIIASVESVGASGAYYIASACDKIYANQASVVGSIGVIMEWTNYGDLMRWAKLKPVVIHAGELKDAGDPTHDMTPQEAAYFQSLVDNMYTQFIHDVASGRHTSDATIRPLATGQVWTGQQSLPLGLIDKIGGYRSALIDTARDVGIKGEPAIVRPASSKKGLAALINGDADELFPNPTKLLDRSPGFFFLWK